ncbi:MAG: cytochrome c oxidase subunit 3 [Bacteroidetes bacterium]|nr:cytochrome c oxidase subunit 3 [Bacteroidota bacterium]
MEMALRSPQEELELRKKAKKTLLWVGLVSIIMMFAGLTSAYIVRMAEGNWQDFALPQMFYFSTAVLLLSSITMNMAMSAAKRDDMARVKSFIWLTFVLGVAFVGFQFSGWKDLISQDIYFSGGNASGSYLYVLSGLHLAHVLGGLAALLITGVRALYNIYHSKNLLGLQLCSIYWHFLDFLWIYLFLFLLLIR